MKGQLKYHRLTILWALFIFVLCTIKIGESITHEPIFFPGFDKIAHCGFFFVLVTFWSNGLLRQQNGRMLSYKSAAMVTVLSILYGALMEVLQLTIFTWRSGEWPDLFADTIGVCMGIFAVIVTGRAINYEKS
jgi:VanZ family protein